LNRSLDLKTHFYILFKNTKYKFHIMTKQKIILAIFLTCSLAVTFSMHKTYGQKKKNSIELKVAAYNVEFSDKGSAQEIGEMLKPYNFDVVCFSEAPGGSWTEGVGKVMGLNHVVVGRYSTAGHEDKYKTIASRTPLTNYEEVLMADTLHTVTRALTEVDGKKIAVYAVHFPFGWRDQAHIDETTGKVTAFVDYLKERQSDELSIVMGDFNFVLSTDDYKSPYYEMFVDIGLNVSWRDLKTDVTPLSSMVRKSKRDTKGRGRVIDHIMYNSKRVKALEGEIIEMDKPLSDHKPVWALLEIK
jgi:exonuclease III